ncbi:MAG: phenylalanine--tRNA ligase subunit beta, partial [Lachnospiraceae bacterium]|nr:phenylalanine--tRNA ligase subunit beta [Lachnospiraceae bacterium]
PLPKFDVEKRDFAFVVDSSRTCEEIENAIREACPYITSVELFDVYEGAQVLTGMKSMAFSVVFTPTDHAFKDSEIEGFVEEILKELKVRTGAVLRA